MLLLSLKFVFPNSYLAITMSRVLTFAHVPLTGCGVATCAIALALLAPGKLAIAKRTLVALEALVVLDASET